MVLDDGARHSDGGGLGIGPVSFGRRFIGIKVRVLMGYTHNQIGV